MPIFGAPGSGVNTIRNPLTPLGPVNGGRVRVSQHYLEVSESGTSNFVRLSQQYLEVSESGTNNKIRLSQMYIEASVTFGTPPIPDKPKKTPPGQEKKNPPAASSFDLYCNSMDILCHCIDRRRKVSRRSFMPWMDPEWVPIPPPDPIIVTEHYDVVGHTITKRSH